MPTYTDEKQRRISQFAEYLRLMSLRRHKVVHEDCFIVFDDSPPEDAKSPKLKESVAMNVDCFSRGGSASGGGDPAKARRTIGRAGMLSHAISNSPSCRTAFTWNCPTTPSSPRRLSRFSGAAWGSSGHKTDRTFLGSVALERHGEVEPVAEGLPVPGRGIRRRRHGILLFRCGSFPSIRRFTSRRRRFIPTTALKTGSGLIETISFEEHDND